MPLLYFQDFFLFYNLRSIKTNFLVSTFRETFGDATPEIFFQIFWVVNNQSIALYLHALYIVKREFCRLKILQEFSRESWIIFIYSTYIQKDCFSFCTVLESATRWRYIQGNISPFHSFCPLAPSISQKLKLFFWPILSFGDRANSANAFHREPYWSKRQAPFLLSTMKQKIIWISIWILLISCVK